jgi:hypothetical protein
MTEGNAEGVHEASLIPLGRTQLMTLALRAAKNIFHVPSWHGFLSLAVVYYQCVIGNPTLQRIWESSGNSFCPQAAVQPGAGIGPDIVGRADLW